MTAPTLVASVKSCVLSESSALGRVSYALARSWDSSFLPGGPSEDDIRDGEELLRDLVSGLRSGIHERTEVRSEEASLGDLNIFACGPRDFQRLIAKRAAEDVKELIRAYDCGWVHVSVSDIIRFGESRALTEQFKSLKLSPDVEQLEAVAAQYCTQARMRSHLLEWMLVDSLLFAECHAFAQLQLSQKKVLGMTIPESVKGMESATGLRKGAWVVLKQLLIGLVKLGALLLVAGWISQGQDMLFWMVVLAGLMANYLRPVRVDYELQAKLKAAQLLSDMCSAHNVLKHYHFNAPLLRHLLYSVVERGAVFSPYVFNLLDLRIKREVEPYLHSHNSAAG